jgi:glyoxylase-like metal-dependent hydrolase (beta-lactamase superfamily II)
MAGFHFDETQTAIRQIERFGYHSTDVTDIVLTHGDPDHAGGLSDFPNARVHTSEEELAAIKDGHWRYRPQQFAHGVHWQQHPVAQRTWCGLEARSLPLPLDSEVLLIPLFGHTAGHCGVTIQLGEDWMLHVGDAYYLRVELTSDDHPVSQLAAQRAVDDTRRLKSLEELRRLFRDYSKLITMIGYHDILELPQQCLPTA